MNLTVDLVCGVCIIVYIADVRQWWTLSDNYESSVTGIISTFQIIHAAAAFNIGSTYRKGFFRNTSFIVMYAILFTFLSVVLLADPNSLGCLFRIKYVPSH
jgi:hypothetical protein